jgi:transposase
VLEAALRVAFGAHSDAAIVQSQPGLGVVLAARVLAEFGDDPNRYASAWTSPRETDTGAMRPWSMLAG